METGVLCYMDHIMEQPNNVVPW